MRGVASFSLVGDEIYSVWETRSAREAAAALTVGEAWSQRLAMVFTNRRITPPALDPAMAWRMRWAFRTSPLYVLLNEAAVALFGDSILAYRLFPLLFGLLALIVLPLLLRRLAGARAALVLLALLALCPDHVLLSKLARYQSASFFFGGIAALSAALYAKERRTRDELVSLVASLLLVATHLTGALVATTLLVHLALLLHGRIARVALPVAALGSAGLLLFGSLHRVADVIGSGLHRLPRVGALWRLPASLLYNVGPAAAAGVAAALVRARRAGLSGFAPLVSAVALPAAVLFAASHWKDVGARYFAAIAACWLALAALGVEALWRGATTRRLATAALALLLLLQVPALASDWIDGQRYDYRAAAADLAQRAPAGTTIVSESGGLLDYYLTDRPPVVEMPGSLAALEQRLLAGSHPRAFLVVQRQRGNYAWSGNVPRLTKWLADHAQPVATLGARRFDDPLYRFELEIDEVDVAALAAAPR